MGFNIAGLGSLAEGFQRGMERGQASRFREEDQSFQNEQRGRERKKWKQQDDELAVEQQANEAAQRVIREDMAQMRTQPAPMQAPQGGALPPAQPMQPGALGQGLGAASPAPSEPTPTPSLGAAQPAQPAAAPMGAQPQQQYRPSDATVLRAARARTDTLFAAGRTEKGLQQWAQDEGYRFKVRAAIAPSVKAALGSGGDISKPLKDFYDTLDDGNDLESVVPSQGLDGKPSYTLTTVNQLTGKKESKTLTAEQIASTVDQVMENPAEAAKHAAAMKLEAFKRASTHAENEQKRKHELERVDREVAGRKEVAKITGASREAAAETRADGSMEVARIRGAGGGGGAGAAGGKKIQRTMVDGDGYMVGVFKDGSTERLKIDGQPVKSGEWGKRVDSMAKELAKGIGGMKSTPEQLRQQAEATLSSGKPALQAPSTLPEGSKQIGTSGGKPVYQTPDGKRFIQD